MTTSALPAWYDGDAAGRESRAIASQMGLGVGSELCIGGDAYLIIGLHPTWVEGVRTSEDGHRVTVDGESLRHSLDLRLHGWRTARRAEPFGDGGPA